MSKKLSILKNLVNIYFVGLYISCVVEILVYFSSTTLLNIPYYTLLGRILEKINLVSSVLYLPFREILHSVYPLNPGGSHLISLQLLPTLIILVIFSVGMDKLRVIIINYITRKDNFEEASRKLRFASASMIVIFLIGTAVDLVESIDVIRVGLPFFMSAFFSRVSSITLLLAFLVELSRALLLRQISLEKEIESIV